MITVLTAHNTAAAEKLQYIKSSTTDHIQVNAIEDLHHRAIDTHPLPMVNHKRTLNSLNCASANDGFGKTGIGTHLVETISRSKVLQRAGRETRDTGKMITATITTTEGAALHHEGGWAEEPTTIKIMRNTDHQATRAVAEVSEEIDHPTMAVHPAEK